MVKEMSTHADNKTASLPVQHGLVQRRLGDACGHHPGVQADCSECQRSKGLLQRQSAHQFAPAEVPPIVHQVLRSPGQPLDPATGAVMATHFGHDFSRVRLHTDQQAAASANVVNAHAYTVGRHVVFGPGQYTPHSPQGQYLLGHELTHVMQQRGVTDVSPTSIEIGAANDRCEQQAERHAQAVQSHQRLPSVGAGLPALRLQRVSFGEEFLRFIGFEGTFEDEELLAYLDFLDINNRIEDAFDSDNKARAIVKLWQSGDRRYVLPIKRKVLLIQEMLSGFTGNDDEDAILALLRGSKDIEIEIIVRTISVARLNRNFHYQQQDELDRFLASWRRRMGYESEGDPEPAGNTQPEGDAERSEATADEDYIQRIVVDQETTQTVTAYWESGRTDRDICSTGKGHCCVDATQGDAAACSEAGSRVSGSNCTPVGTHTVAKKIPETGGGVELWTEFMDDRDIALHEYRPVDGTPLSHGCVRLNRPMAQLIYDHSVEPRSARRLRVSPTTVEIKGLARPYCHYPPLQREWVGDFKTAGRQPDDGETFSARTRRSIRNIRRTLRQEMGLNDEELDAAIARLEQQTGGRMTLSAVAPVASLIPRCETPEEE
ncbi:MAG: DUF4157 domain-containing protein [Cyanobacteria bacterium P01_F01_bin.56]